jgi:phage shock protein E
MKRLFVVSLSLFVAAFIAIMLSSCGTPDRVASSVAVSEETGTVLVDVRTPEEFVSGHLDGAMNVPAEAVDFDQLIAELDREQTYVVYCRSGRRSQQAVSLMQEAGFTRLIDLGSLENAQKYTGLGVVRWVG